MIDSYSLADIVHNVSKQKERLILDSLGDLINKGLLVVEETNPVLVGGWAEWTNKYEVRLEQQVRVVLKDKEYIEQLEKENNELKNKLDSINNAIKGLDNGND